jgi:hypothetical protein
MLGYIDDMDLILNKAIDSELKGDALERFCNEEMTKFIEKELNLRGLKNTGSIKNLLETDIELNAMGLAMIAEKRH